MFHFQDALNLSRQQIQELMALRRIFLPKMGQLLKDRQRISRALQDSQVPFRTLLWLTVCPLPLLALCWLIACPLPLLPLYLVYFLPLSCLLLALVLPTVCSLPASACPLRHFFASVCLVGVRDHCLHLLDPWVPIAGNTPKGA